MAGGVKLSIYSTFDKKGVDQADRAVKAFTRRFGELDDATKMKSIDGSTEKLVRMSVGLDQASAKLRSFSKATGAVGTTLTKGVTVPMGVAAAVTVRKATQIDTALTNVRKTVDGTEQEYQELKNAALEYSKVNATSAEEVLNAQALGAQLGFNIQELDKFSRVATGMSIATDMDMETASTEMAQFANITDMAHDDIDRYGSSIVALGNNLATTESKVSSMAQRVGAAGKQVGMSQSQILGWSGAMSSVGIEAEAGGTAFSTTISTIDKQVATGGKLLKEYARVSGMSASEFSKAWGKDASGAFQRILEGVSKSDNMSVELQKLGISGIRTTDMMKRLAGNTELVSKAVGIANDGWEQNNALTNEVANRNDSLESKMKMLENRATATAEKVGKPLAEAMLDAFDAAEPLIEAIEDGAQAFADMDEAEQQQVLTMLAMAAAAGPTLTAVSKVTGTMASGATIAAQFTSKMAAGEGALAKLAATVGPARLGLVGIGVAAAGAVAAIGINEWNEYQSELKRTHDAGMTVSEMLAKVKGGSYDSMSAMQTASGAAQMLSDDYKDLVRLQEDMARSNNEFVDSMTNAQVDASQLQAYVDVIADLGRKDKLSAADQETLKNAVKGYNDITGDSVSVTNAAKGELDKSTAAIRKNADAWKHNAEMQAYQELYGEKAKEVAQAQVGLQKSTEAVAAAEKRLNEVRNGPATADYAGQLEMANRALEEAKKNQAGYKRTLADGKRELKDIANVQSKASKAYDKSEKSVGSLKKAIKNMGPSTKKVLSDTKTSSADLARSFNSAGIKSKSLAGITDSAFAKMWKSCNGDVNKMKAKLDEYNKKKVEDKKAKVSIGGNLMDGTVLSRMRNYNSTVLNNKSATMTVTKVTKTKQSAAGGVHKMASGGIATGPMMLNANTLIGEAGTEAFFQRGRTATVIPLSNRHYVRPFAQAVAAEMGGGGGTVNNYTIGSVSVPAGSAVADALEAVFSEAMRIARMR